ncbi:MAG: arginine--tRNA ligase [Candidatus Omnitrophica bacterium]|nr:arginine--tRNA ligase [Candidatus Omnitrophota bacterium]
MRKDIKAVIASSLKESLRIFQIPPERIRSLSIQLDIPKDESFGDISSNLAMQLSKDLKQQARSIADSLVEHLKRDQRLMPPKGLVKDIKAQDPGFINFYLSDEYFYGRLRDALILSGRFGSSKSGRGKKALIEFVSANPTGPLSVAHARQAAVGDSLASILEFLGFRVTREYYLNDKGNQINILGRSVMLRARELKGESVAFPEDHYQGDYIRDIAKEVIGLGRENEGEKWFCDYAVEYLMGIIGAELRDFGTGFDVWYSQAALERSGKIEKAIGHLKKKGCVYENEGAVWFRSTSFGDDKDRVIIKSDGSYTYITPDIAYHEDKFRRGFDWLINLWGPDHHGYIGRIKAAVAALGKNKEALSLIIVQLASIFRDGKQLLMSTRKGQYITLRQVLDEVGRDASRFFFLMRRTSSHLDFDIDLAKKHSQENPVFYVQYAHARISSILKNARAGFNLKRADLKLLKQKEELFLMRAISRFPYVLEVCLSSLDPFFVTEYLKRMAEAFHKFYDNHRVLGDDKRLTEARLALIKAAQIVLSNGFRLLGISAPEKM